MTTLDTSYGPGSTHREATVGLGPPWRRKCRARSGDSFSRSSSSGQPCHLLSWLSCPFFLQLDGLLLHADASLWPASALEISE